MVLPENRVTFDPQDTENGRYLKNPLPVPKRRTTFDPQDTENGRYLKNPLPVPKRRTHTRMEFDLADSWDIPGEQDHFDIEISEDDDFDI
jgi:hypothetical protein